MTCRVRVAPRPPCSAGQPRQVQPAAARCRFQASRSSCRSCSRPGPPAPRRPANSPVRLASSHARTSARNSSSCGVNRTPGHLLRSVITYQALACLAVAGGGGGCGWWGGGRGGGGGGGGGGGEGRKKGGRCGGADGPGRRGPGGAG